LRTKWLTSSLGSLLGPSSAALQDMQSRFWKAISVSVTIEERDEIYQAVEDFLTDLSKESKINDLIVTKNITTNPPETTSLLTKLNASNVQYAPGKI
jgi:DNA polymerase elongation subunit (family B)